MKGRLFYLLLSFFCAAGFAACNNGEYDANPAGVNNNKNYLDSLLNGDTSGTGTTGTSFNWTGTAPMSAKIEGADFLAETNFAGDILGDIQLGGYNTSGDRGISIQFPGSASVDQVFSLGAGGAASATLREGDLADPDARTFGSAAGSGGSLKITRIDADTVEGYFFFNAKEVIAGSGVGTDTRNVTQGYFKIERF